MNFSSQCYLTLVTTMLYAFHCTMLHDPFHHNAPCACQHNAPWHMSSQCAMRLSSQCSPILSSQCSITLVFTMLHAFLIKMLSHHWYHNVTSLFITILPHPCQNNVPWLLSSQCYMHLSSQCSMTPDITMFLNHCHKNAPWPFLSKCSMTADITVFHQPCHQNIPWPTSG